MSTRLDERLVADALGVLRDWQGGTDEIQREVRLPSSAVAAPILAAVEEAAQHLDDEPRVQRSDNWLRIALTTPVVGGVSDHDIALATRIDDLIRDAGGDVHHEHGRLEDRDIDIVAEGMPAADHDHDQLEPLIGAPSPPAAGTRGPGAVLPDTAPGRPEPGLATPHGQGLHPDSGEEAGS